MMPPNERKILSFDTYKKTLMDYTFDRCEISKLIKHDLIDYQTRNIEHETMPIDDVALHSNQLTLESLSHVRTQYLINLLNTLILFKLYSIKY